MKAAEKSRKIRSELMILEALVVAIDRREELFAVLEESENDQQSRLVLGERLGLDEMQIRAILDMQIRRFTPANRRMIQEHIVVLNHELGALG